MSSFVGHALVGAAAYVCGRREDEDRSPAWLVLLMGAALLPDIDYALVWLLGVDVQPRLTHSLGFALMVGVSLVLLGRAPTSLRRDAPHPVAMFVAALSHTLLDALVAVHPNPLFWPLTEATVTLPLGVLPSAGALSFTNPILWRNLLIEAGILLPVVGFAWVVTGKRWGRVHPLVWVLSSLCFLSFVVWGSSLSR